MNEGTTPHVLFFQSSEEKVSLSHSPTAVAKWAGAPSYNVPRLCGHPCVFSFGPSWLLLLLISQIFYRYREPEYVIPKIGDLMVKRCFFDVAVKIWDHCHSTDTEEDSYLKSPSYKAVRWISRLKSSCFLFMHFVLPVSCSLIVDKQNKQTTVWVGSSFIYGRSFVCV